MTTKVEDKTLLEIFNSWKESRHAASDFFAQPDPKLIKFELRRFPGVSMLNGKFSPTGKLIVIRAWDDQDELEVSKFTRNENILEDVSEIYQPAGASVTVLREDSTEVMISSLFLWGIKYPEKKYSLKPAALLPSDQETQLNHGCVYFGIIEEIHEVKPRASVMNFLTRKEMEPVIELELAHGVVRRVVMSPERVKMVKPGLVYLELYNGSWNILPMDSTKRVIYYGSEDYSEAISDINRICNNSENRPTIIANGPTKQKGHWFG